MSSVCEAGQAASVSGGGEDNYRVVSANTMKLLLPIRIARQAELVFSMRPNQIAIRINAASRQGRGWERATLGTASPWASVKPRFQAFLARSLVRRERVSAYGAASKAIRVPLDNALCDARAQLFPTKRPEPVWLPRGQRSELWIVIIYVGDIRYQSGEGRLSDEDVDELGRSR